MADLRTRAAQARDEGFTFFVHLTGIDELGRSDDIRLVLRLERPDDGEVAEIAVLVPRDGGTAERIDDLFPGAAWHQRQVHDLFGIGFTGADLRPLVHHGDSAPLRKEVLLAPRQEVSWPGAIEPGQSAPGRRKLLPPGVPDERGSR